MKKILITGILLTISLVGFTQGEVTITGIQFNKRMKGDTLIYSLPSNNVEYIVEAAKKIANKLDREGYSYITNKTTTKYSEFTDYKSQRLIFYNPNSRKQIALRVEELTETNWGARYGLEKHPPLYSFSIEITKPDKPPVYDEVSF